ncbi:MAG: hypothetical protein ACREVG_04735, partial [Burkholderiales bacterium]
MTVPEYALELLLAYDGRLHYFASGHYLKFEVKMRLRIQSMKELRAEMISAARGERKAPAGAARASFESVEALMRLLTPENRQLLAAIENRKPASVAD